MPASPSPARRNNLPTLPTRLIGREAELAEITQLINQSDYSLITLVGHGGVGKTHLALAVAAACADEFADGAYFVPLTPLSASEFMASAIASAIRFPIFGPGEPEVQLLSYLREKEILLVLDNLEHLLSDIHLVVNMLQSGPRVKILATSRERLNLLHERVYDLKGLPIPAPGLAAEIEENSAVRVFKYAAQRQRYSFTITEQNRDEITRICALVDGNPLSLELAAAWTPVLSCRDIARNIESSLDFLIDSARDRSERHRSLRAVFDHSWRLLTADEQRVLRQLTVFRGGFEREAAEQVAGATLFILSGLINKSLLRRAEAGRYDLHELIRQYSALKLNEAGEEAATREKHFNFFLSLAEDVAPHLTTTQRGAWLERLEFERDNLRTALGWSQGETGSRQQMLQLAGVLNWYWYLRGDLSEGRAWLDSALKGAAGTQVVDIRARALFGGGCLARQQGDNTLAWPLLEESIALWRTCGDSGKSGLAYALCYLGALAREKGDMPLAYSLSVEGIDLFNEQEDPWGRSFGLITLGMVLRDQADYAGARLMLQESLALMREIEDMWGIADALHHLGLVALRQGDYETAQSRFEESLGLRQQLGNKHGIAYSVHSIGIAVINQGRIGPAKPYLQLSQTLFRELGDKYGLASALSYLGYVALFEGDVTGARYLFEKSLGLARDGGPRWLIAIPLARCAGLAAVCGWVIQAMTLWEAVEAHMETCFSYLDQADRIYYEHTIAPACVNLSEHAVAMARADGRRMTLEEAVQLAWRVIRSDF